MNRVIDHGRAADATKMTVRRLSPVMGAEIVGLDLAQPLAHAQRAQVERAFNEHKVLCFRDQELSMDEFLAFSKSWGPLTEHTMPGLPRDGITEVSIGSNAGPGGKRAGKHPDVTAMRWQTDRSWRVDPAVATILYGVEVPNVGGDTLFANCTMAYDALPAAMKERIADLFAIHSVEYSRNTGDGPKATGYELRNHPPAPHPLARIHPVTGRRAIYCGCHAWKIQGMPEGEGRRLLDELLAFATQDAYIYRHKWRRHDMLMWDDRCTLHAATPYDTSNELRTMYRTVVAGSRTH